MSRLGPNVKLTLSATERDNVAELFAGVGVVGDGTDRYRDDQVVAALAGAVLAHAGLAASGLEEGLEAEVGEGVQVVGRFQEHAAAIPAVAAVGATFGDVLLAPETDATIATVAGRNADKGFIYEFHRASLLGPQNREHRGFKRIHSGETPCACCTP